MTEESRTDFSSNQSRKPFFSPAYATKRFIAIFRQSRLQTVSPGLSARALVSPKKKPQSNPHPNFSTKFDGSRLAKIQQTRQRNPSHPSSSERSIGRTIRSIERFDRVASRRSLTVDDVERIASRSPRLTTRTSVAPKRHGPSVTDRSIDRSTDGRPPILLSTRGSHTHNRASHRSIRVEKTHLARRLLGGNLSGTTALGVRGGDDDSGGAHGKHLFGFGFAGFVRSREVTPSLGSARLHPPRAGASFGVVRRRFPR